MARPSTRQEFKDYCLRSLGYPVVKINVSPEQVDDRIDDAIQYFQEMHYDGSIRCYLKHRITDSDIANKFVSVPEHVLGVVRIFPVYSSLVSGSSPFTDITYQWAMSDVWNWSSGDVVSLVMAQANIQMYETILGNQHPVQHSRYEQRLYVDMDWSRVTVGQYLVIECYRAIDPCTIPGAWNDPWLKQFAVQMIKRQWGENLKKFGGVQLMGGVTFNGSEIWLEADTRIRELQAEMTLNWGPIPTDMIG